MRDERAIPRVAGGDRGGRTVPLSSHRKARQDSVRGSKRDPSHPTWTRSLTMTIKEPRHRFLAISIAFAPLLILSGMAISLRSPSLAARTPSADAAINDHARELLEKGRQVFRYDTFGDE